MPKHESATTTAAEKIRKLNPPSREELIVLKAGIALRRARGAYRDLYSTEEIELMAQARRTAFHTGQLRLSRYLLLRKRRNKKLSVSLGGTRHRCPKCGCLHHEPTRRISQALIDAEKREIQRVLKGLQ